MKMNAEQMFNALGFYKKDVGYGNILCYEKYVGSPKIPHVIGIQFVLNNEYASIYSEFEGDNEYDAFNYLDVKLLNAINEQFKELGWEEETCQNLSEYDSMDEFQCSNCGFTLVEHKEYLVGEDEDEEYYFNYRPKYCPNCGRKIVEEDKK